MGMAVATYACASHGLPIGLISDYSFHLIAVRTAIID